MLFLFQGCIGLNFEEWTGFTGRRAGGLSWAQTIDRITGLHDLQDKLCWAKLGVKNGQDGRITRFTG